MTYVLCAICGYLSGRAFRAGHDLRAVVWASIAVGCIVKAAQ